MGMHKIKVSCSACSHSSSHVLAHKAQGHHDIMSKKATASNNGRVITSIFNTKTKIKLFIKCTCVKEKTAQPSPPTPGESFSRGYPRRVALLLSAFFLFRFFADRVAEGIIACSISANFCVTRARAQFLKLPAAGRRLLSLLCTYLVAVPAPIHCDHHRISAGCLKDGALCTSTIFRTGRAIDNLRH